MNYVCSDSDFAYYCAALGKSPSLSVLGHGMNKTESQGPLPHSNDKIK